MKNFYSFVLALCVLGISYPQLELAAQAPIELNAEQCERISHIVDNAQKIVMDELQPGEEYRLHISSPDGSISVIQHSYVVSDETTDDRSFKSVKLPETLRFIANTDEMKFVLRTKQAVELSFSILKSHDKNHVHRSSGISIDPNITGLELIEDVFLGNSGFTVANLKTIGSEVGQAYFTNGNPALGIESGVMLTTGPASDYSAPNVSTNTGTSLGESGDVDLSDIASSNTNDAVGIEFDLVPTVEQLSFRFVFASDEYCEYSLSSFNDVFGFFLSGPGIDGPFKQGAVNIARIPDTDKYISINNVNYTKQDSYYVNNAPQFSGGGGGDCASGEVSSGGNYLDFVEFDGYTIPMEATVNVIPNETYHIKIVVADASDGIWDSGVFLEEGSFRFSPKINPPDRLSCHNNPVKLEISELSKAPYYMYHWKDNSGDTIGIGEQIWVDKAGKYHVDVRDTVVGSMSSATVSVQGGTMNKPKPAFNYESTGRSLSFSDMSGNNPEQWKWHFGDGTTSTEEHPSHLYSKHGTYEVCLTVSNECGSSTYCRSIQVNRFPGLDDYVTDQVVSNQTAGAESWGFKQAGEDSEIAEEFNVFPNPVTSHLHIRTKWNNKAHVQVRLVDPMGRIQWIYEEHTNTLNRSIDLQELSRGVYILILEQEGQMHYRRVIKQ